MGGSWGSQEKGEPMEFKGLQNPGIRGDPMGFVGLQCPQNKEALWGWVGCVPEPRG